MRERSNGLRGMASSAKVGTHDKRGSSAAHVNNHHQHQNAKTNNDDANNNHHHQGAGGGGSASPETAHDSKKGGGGGGGGSSSGSEALPMVWPPKFVIGLTNKEKEEDFMAIKGSKLPQRPKKRAKFIQRTLNLISPGAWLCDLSLERYEVREKKVSKKRPRGLKAMGNMESDSENGSGERSRAKLILNSICKGKMLS
ncbi:putative vacuolar-processing enzyme-like [Capsicum annuum]|nr:putative vacuolar-processing enzyme-like [Capsicum annuum]